MLLRMKIGMRWMHRKARLIRIRLLLKLLWWIHNSLWNGNVRIPVLTIGVWYG